MTNKELGKLFLKTEFGVFMPLYDYVDFKFNEETKEYEYIGFKIIKEAEEVYRDWLNPPIPQPTLEEQLAESNKRVVFVEAAMAQLAMQTAKNTLLK